MHLSVAASKINKWAVRESGDTLEMIERPHGGISFVLADGQSSGEAAKAISIRVVRKVVSELAEGVRDGATARAANDMLYELRRGKVSATLIILSVDLDSNSLVITQCGNSGVYVRQPGGDLQLLESTSPPLGFYQHARPTVDQVYLEPGLIALAFTDGLSHAGEHYGTPLDIPMAFEKIWQTTPTAQAVADGLLERAIEADQNRPRDDTSVLVLHVQSGLPEGPRFMRVEVPLPDRR